MAEVEYVTGPPAYSGQNLSRPSLDKASASEQRCRVQVSLYRHIANLHPGLVYRDPPIDSHHISTRLSHRPEYPCGSNPEMDAGNTCV